MWGRCRITHCHNKCSSNPKKKWSLSLLLVNIGHVITELRGVFQDTKALSKQFIAWDEPIRKLLEEFSCNMSPEGGASPMSSSSSCSSPAFPPPDSHFIGKKEDIVEARRVTKLVNGCRDVLVLHHQGRLHAIDMRCYHSGGALDHGDIEEFDGRLCIVCPWHKYKITLAEGEGLYQAVDNPGVKPLRTYWRSKGVKQRIHRVTEVNGDVYVTLNSSTEVIESDTYQTERYRAAFLSPQLRLNVKEQH